VIWQGVDDVPVLAANQIVVQLDSPGGRPEHILLTFGHAAPPIIIGSPEEQQIALSDTKTVPIKPLARFSMSPSRVRDLIRILEESVHNFDARLEEGS
jgi:hypothetical protein